MWNEKSVPKQPVLAVAAYRALVLASLIAFGAQRGAAQEALPQWRPESLLAFMPGSGHPIRKELAEQPELLKEFDVKVTEKQLVRAAAA